jgi:hypothetical protein
MSKYMPKVYKSYEDFERDELRRGGSLQVTIDDMLDDMFAEELDFDFDGGGRGRKAAADDDEEG